MYALLITVPVQIRMQYMIAGINISIDTLLLMI